MTIKLKIAEVKSRIENVLESKLDNAHIADQRLKEAMRYSLLLGGKRVRPLLVYATGEMFGASLEDLDAAAAALESIHSYSLIHDDLPAMDDDELRRGQPTCHIQFDEATAILAGDTLQSFAFSSIAQHTFKNVSLENQLKLFGLISSAANQMCAGQSIDLQNTDLLKENNRSHSISELENMHKLKTGALIVAAVKAGAVTGNANDNELSILTRYAEAIGLAFQVWDDVLDITSDTKTLGKPQGSDVAANKTTYPALIGLEQTKDKANMLIADALAALDELPYETQVLRQLAQYIIQRDH